jgi:Fe-S cluster biogenesis protein NfuA
MSAMTLKAGVEDAIRQALPEITRVVAINPAEAVS